MTSFKLQYLFLYNSIFTILWFTLLLRMITLRSSSAYEKTYDLTGNFSRWIQTAALLDVLHAAVGLVRAPLLPTLVQTVAKNLVLWTIIFPFPRITLSLAYTILLTVWSISEVIRYLYYALMLSGCASRMITWLRYSAFILIYPIGILCEMWLVFSAIGRCNTAWVTAIMWAELALYVPGSYFLYTYMLAQRARIFKM